MVIEITLYVVLLLTAFPVGWALAWFTKEELVPGRKWLQAFAYVCLCLFVLGLLFYRNYSILFTLFYMIIVAEMSIRKSLDKKFVE